ncbi:hypothetical protein [Burkholderia alba]|uniref:hypothetical protein n=1 Tax=Burkholderia alba TaxID=2683677 RepID=UPI002B05F1F9|nr:hypothetical protein [Burkholderia alba]
MPNTKKLTVSEARPMITPIAISPGLGGWLGRSSPDVSFNDVLEFALAGTTPLEDIYACLPRERQNISTLPSQRIAIQLIFRKLNFISADHNNIF